MLGGVWAMRRTSEEDDPPPVAPAVPSAPKPVPIKPDLDGTVPAARVPYGPDGGGLRADPAFRPTRPLAPGIGLYATVGKVFWGRGDPHARMLDRPLSSQEENELRVATEELLRYVRRDAARRRLEADSTGVIVTGTTYGGTGSAAVTLPAANAAYDEAAARRAAGDLVASLQDQLRWHGKARRNEDP